MAAVIVHRGLDRGLINWSQTSTFATARHIRSLAVDDSTSAFTSTHQSIEDPSTVSNEFDLAFDSTPADPSTRTVSHVATIPVGSGNFTITRISLHDDTTANLTKTSTTLVGGIDGQSLTKTSDFTMQITVNLSLTDNS